MEDQEPILHKTGLQNGKVSLSGGDCGWNINTQGTTPLLCFTRGAGDLLYLSDSLMRHLKEGISNKGAFSALLLERRPEFLPLRTLLNLIS